METIPFARCTFVPFSEPFQPHETDHGPFLFNTPVESPNNGHQKWLVIICINDECDKKRIL